MTDNDIEVQSTGLHVISELDYKTWTEYMEQALERRQEALDHVERVSMWIIGDLYVYGEDRFGEDEAAQVAQPYSAETIRNARWVARNIPPEEREQSLAFGHHQVVAKLESDERKKLLKYAREQELSVYALRKYIRKEPKGRGSGKGAGGPAYDPETAGQRQNEDSLSQRRHPPSDEDTPGKCPFCGESAALSEFRRSS